MNVEIIRNHINGYDTYIIGNWILADGNLVFHKNDLFDIKDRYPQIEESHLDQIRPYLNDQQDDPHKVMELATTLKNKGLYAMAIYMKKGYREMDNSYLQLKKKLHQTKETV